MESMEGAARLCPLRQALSYRNERVVRKFRQQYRVSPREADELFRETVKWLWLAARSAQIPGAPKPAMLGAQRMLDEMWHTFILFSADYREFCLGHFGRVVDHLPSEGGDSRTREESLAYLTRVCDLIYQELDVETARRWFVEFPERYSLEAIDARRIPFARSSRHPARRKSARGRPTARAQRAIGRKSASRSARS